MAVLLQEDPKASFSYSRRATQKAAKEDLLPAPLFSPPIDSSTPKTHFVLTCWLLLLLSLRRFVDPAGGDVTSKAGRKFSGDTI